MGSMDTRILAKNFLIYASGAALLRSLSFLTAPITMFYLTPERYGALSLIHSTVIVLALVCGIGLRQVFLIEYFSCDANGAKRLVNDLLLLYLVIALPLLGLLIYFVPTILTKLAIEPTAFTYSIIVIILLIIFFTFFVELFNQVLQYQQQAQVLIIAQVVIASAAAGLQIVGLSVLHWDIISIFFAQLLAYIATVSIGIYGYFKYGYWSEFSLMRTVRKSWYYLKNGISFMPSMLAGWLMIAGNRFVIAYCSSLHDAGIYAVTDTLGQLFNLLVVTSLSNAYVPLIMRSFADSQANPVVVEAKNRKIMYACMAVGLVLIIIGCTAGKPFLRLLFPPAYYAALDYMPFLLIAYLFYMGATFASALIQWQKKIYFLSGSLIATAALQVVLSMLLVPWLSIYGSIIACMISYVIYFLVTLLFNNYLLNKAKAIASVAGLGPVP